MAEVIDKLPRLRGRRPYVIWHNGAPLPREQKRPPLDELREVCMTSALKLQKVGIYGCVEGLKCRYGCGSDNQLVKRLATTIIRIDDYGNIICDNFIDDRPIYIMYSAERQIDLALFIKRNEKMVEELTSEWLQSEAKFAARIPRRNCGAPEQPACGPQGASSFEAAANYLSRIYYDVLARMRERADAQRYSSRERVEELETLLMKVASAVGADAAKAN